MRNVNASPIFPDFCERDIGVDGSNEGGNLHFSAEGEFVSLRVTQLERGASFDQPPAFTVAVAFLCGAGMMFTVFLLVSFGRKIFSRK